MSHIWRRHVANLSKACRTCVYRYVLRECVTFMKIWLIFVCEIRLMHIGDTQMPLDTLETRMYQLYKWVISHTQKSAKSSYKWHIRAERIYSHECVTYMNESYHTFISLDIFCADVTRDWFMHLTWRSSLSRDMYIAIYTSSSLHFCGIPHYNQIARDAFLVAMACTHKRDLNLCKETYKRDLQKRPTNMRGCCLSRARGWADMC